MRVPVERAPLTRAAAGSWRTGVLLPVAPVPPWEEAERLTPERCRDVFDAVPPFTMGVEEELMLVRPDTLALAPDAPEVLRLLPADGPFRPELRAAQLEIVTPVCTGPAEACHALAAARAELVERLERRYRLVGAGTHPLDESWGEITPTARYELLADEYEWASRRAVVSGLHVHVAVGGADRTLAVYNALRSYLPEIGALASNSPFVAGRDTGLCSMRIKLQEAFPRAGVPPVLWEWADFVELLDWGRAGGLFPDASHLWWDLRPSPGYGTLEIRIADAQTRVEDAAAVAAFVHALVVWLAQRWEAGERLPVDDHFRVHENCWRALRHGVTGWLVDLETGEREPTRERIARLLDHLEPVAGELGSEEQLRGARVLLAGNGADRQRYVAARDGLPGLLGWLADETEAAG